MRLIILALALALPLVAGQDLQITGDAGSYTIPASAPFTALSERRIEGRADVTSHDCTSNQFHRIARIGNALNVGCISTSTPTLFGIRMTSSAVSVDVAARTDIVFRAQILPAGSVQEFGSNNWGPNDNVAYLEIWDSDGTDYEAAILTNFSTTIPEDVSGSQTIGGVGISNVDVSWIKQYSTVIQPGPNSPLPDTEGSGDLGDWDFEGDGVDSSAHAMTITCASCTFGASAASLPVADIYLGEANWATNPVVRAGATVTLDGTPSISHDDVSTLTCVWSDQGGGSSGVDEIQFIGSTTACTTTAVFPTFGQYALRLVVTDDSTDTSTKNVTVGATATDQHNVVVVPSSTYDYIVGPMKRWGTNDWPWLDYVQQDLVELYGSTMPTEDWNTAAAGTVTVSASTTVTGSGTDFQNDFCGGGSTPGTTRLVIHASDGFNWDVSIASCDSTTQITLTNTWDLTAEGGLSYSIWGATNHTDWTFNSSPENFYDNVLGHYAHWLSTGLTQPLTYGRQLAAAWWDIPHVNKGSAYDSPDGSGDGTSPRNYSLAGIAAWAHDQGTESTVWPGIEHYLVDGSSNWITAESDTRETGYVMAYLAMCEHLAPGGTEQTSCQTNFDSMVTTGRFDPATYRGPNNGWMISAEGTATIPDSTLGTGTFEKVNGSNVFTCNTVASPTDTCGWTSALDNQWVQIVPAGDTSDVFSIPTEYQVSAATTTTLTLTSNFVGTGATGQKLRYSLRHNHYYKPFYEAIPAHAFRWAQEAGNADFRQEVVDGANFLRQYGTNDFAAALYNRTDDAGCAYNLANDIDDPVQATGCEYDEDAQVDINFRRYLNLEALGGLAWAVKYADDLVDGTATTLRTYVDDTFGATWGKWGGPFSDGGYAHELDNTDGNKDFGFALGWGQDYQWPAMRIGGVEPELLVSYAVPIDIGSVAMATKASVTLYEPKGSVNRVVNDQTGSIALVTGDARQGSHLAKIEYKDAMDAILQTDWTMTEMPAGALGVKAITGTTSITGAITF